MKKLKLSIAAIVILVASSAEAQVPALDAYIENVRKTFNVPGLSVAVVKDGVIVFAKGYGLRETGKPAATDSHTLFGIASNTKAFTATALAMLVEEGKVEWDKPVINYLPWFRLSDPYVTAELTVRDLLVHRSGLGLGAGDLLWWPSSTYTRREIAERLRFLPLVTSFRSAYAYDNTLYLIAGELIEAVSGKTWEEFITQRIFAKVGMKESTVHFSASGNVALPHAEINGVVKTVEPFASDNVNPPGGINSSAEDMARWMIVQLDSGRISKSERIFSRRSANQLWSIVTPIPVNGDPPPELAALKPSFNGYALGFGIRDYRGKKIVSHTGGLPGYVSKVAMIPELKLGVVILTNQESGSAFESIAYRVMDSYLGAPATDWTAIFKKLSDRNQAGIKESDAQATAARNSKSTPSLALSAYAGTYTDKWYGDIVIKQNGNALQIDFTKTPALKGKLEHWQYDTFVVRWNDRDLRADAFITFSLSPGGKIDHAKMEAASPSVDFSFDFQDLNLIPKR